MKKQTLFISAILISFILLTSCGGALGVQRFNARTIGDFLEHSAHRSVTQIHS